MKDKFIFSLQLIYFFLGFFVVDYCHKEPFRVHSDGI